MRCLPRVSTSPACLKKPTDNPYGQGRGRGAGVGPRTGSDPMGYVRGPTPWGNGCVSQVAGVGLTAGVAHKLRVVNCVVLAGLEINDVLERVVEVQLVAVLFHVAQVRRGQHGGDAQQL